ncbi:ceramide glucosyltransferase [Methylobacterium sp. NEAU K]|uniref:ceramide glucosyltransferase n=1 Tax=Methylobacterium sp. NEAU K TaxID=3064946 RepID=UPI002737180B|nr:ceramide glucosyltransferase [Methylobacterium sp. NEAU K]MDP4004541.1 ceramide glucosyltransferase [Methylobacterium sp. NEAU K]
MIDATVPALSLGALLALVQIASIAIAGRRIGEVHGPSRFPAGAPVSLVRPLRGVEAFSEEMLSRSFRLAYPAYELIFCVADPADPIVPMVERLVSAHPHVPARLILGDERVSDNPKLNNCLRGWRAAAHDWVVLADSNVAMPPDYLQRLQAAWRDDTGLVCSTPAGARPASFMAEVECAFLNTLQARWQYAAETFGLGFAQGKSMLWHKPFLDAQGGLQALAAEIAEDAAATKLVRAAGKRVYLVASPFEQPLGPRGFGEVWARQLRWARLRRVTFPLFFAPEIGSGVLLPALLVALWAGSLAGLAGAAGLAALCYLAEHRLATRAGWHRSPRMLAAFLVRDALIPAIWLGAWVQSAIVWRGNAMDVRPRRAGADRACAPTA